jgi:putative selenium metabolism hydrolase
MDEINLRKKISSKTSKNSEKIVAFLTDIVKIPSVDSQIKKVGERICDELRGLGFENIRFDKQGNVQATIGDGSRSLVYDSHIDTVGVGDLNNWKHGPYAGVIENGKLFGRGVCDEKGSTPPMAYGLSFAKELGLLEDTQVTYFGNMEEWCDGIAPRVFCEHDPIMMPDAVLVGEPTNMEVYRGHKGRIEISIKSFGKSAHAASNYLGVNAIYQLIPVIDQIQKIEKNLHVDPFLGQGRITVSDMKVSTPSINAVPD